MFTSIRDYATGIFLTLVGMAIAGFVGANVRAWAHAKGYDTLLLRLSSRLPAGFVGMTIGWPALRQRWWIWLGMGLTGGLAAALWVVTVYSPLLTVVSLAPPQPVAALTYLNNINVSYEIRSDEILLTGSLARDAQKLRVYIEYNERSSGTTRVPISDIVDRTKNETVKVVLAKATQSGASNEWWWGEPTENKRVPIFPDPLFPIYVKVIITGDLGDQSSSFLIMRVNKDLMKNVKDIILGYPPEWVMP